MVISLEIDLSRNMRSVYHRHYDDLFYVVLQNNFREQEYKGVDIFQMYENKVSGTYWMKQGGR